MFPCWVLYKLNSINFYNFRLNFRIGLPSSDGRCIFLELARQEEALSVTGLNQVGAEGIERNENEDIKDRGSDRTKVESMGEPSTRDESPDSLLGETAEEINEQRNNEILFFYLIDQAALEQFKNRQDSTAYTSVVTIKPCDQRS